MLGSIAILVLVFAALLGLFMVSHRMSPLFPDRQIFAPWNTTLIVWTVILSLYLLVHQELYAVSPQFVYGISIWVFTFVAASVAGFLLMPAYHNKEWQVCEKNVDVITIIALVLVPFAVYKAVQHALIMASPDELLRSIREQAINPEENQLGVVKYFAYIINVLLIIELERERIRKFRLTLVAGLGFLFFVATMAKLTLFMYIFSSLYVLYDRRRISLKPIFFFGLFLVALIPVMYFLRGTNDSATDTEVIGNLLIIYMVSSVVAFGEISPCSAAQWGETTLRPFYNIMQGLGFNVATPQPIQDFCNVPVPTNVYSVLFPYYRDFGLWGIFVFALIQGIIIGAIYKQSRSGNNLMKYLYAYIFTLLMMQFFDEQVFQGISSIIQITIVILICHTNFSFNRK